MENLYWKTLGWEIVTIHQPEDKDDKTEDEFDTVDDVVRSIDDIFEIFGIDADAEEFVVEITTPTTKKDSKEESNDAYDRAMKGIK